MGFLGLGTGELIVIAVVALIIFGPGKLPEVAGQVGKALRDFRKMTGDLSDEFEKTAGLEDIKRQVQREISGVQNEVTSVTKGVKKDLTGTAKTPAKPAAKPAAAGAAKTGTATAKASTTAAKTPTATAVKAGIANNLKKAEDAAAAPEPVAPKAPSKADPFADLLAIDAGSPAPAAPAKVVAAKPAPAGQQFDQLAAVRARRAQAGGDRSATGA